MYKFFFLISITFSIATNAQNRKVDSVKNVAKTSKIDSIQVAANLKLFGYYRRRNLDTAMRFVWQAYSMIDKNISERSKSKILNDLSLGFKMRGEIDSALHYLVVQRDIVYAINDAELIGKYHNNLGNIQQNMGDKLKAHENYLKALEAFISAGNRKEEANVQNNIAINFLIDGEFRKGLRYLIYAYKIREEINDNHGVIASLSNIGITFKDLKKYDSAILYLKKSLDLSEKIGSTYGKSAAHNNLSIVYNRLENYELSINHLLQAKDINESSNRKPGMLNNYINIASTYFKMDEFGDALRYARLSNDLSDSLKSIEVKKSANLLLGQVHQELGQYEEAIRYFNIHDILKDSMYNINKTKQLQELEEKYQSSVKDKQISALELEKQYAALIIAKSEYQRNILIAISSIVVIVAILLYFLFSQKRKSLAERDVLLKEIHHRVKNNLQVISSLLNLQADSLDDDIAKDAVKEGQNRVKSMALIHQKLYSADDVRGVNVYGYLDQLSSELFKAFGVDQEKVKWKIDTSDLKLDIDTVIPLGLIINELITNTLKYAFQNAEEGLLEITMREEGENLNIFIKDNGIGMNEESMKTSNSFGWKMIKSLSRKLKAEITIDGTSGTNVQLSLSRYKLVS